MQIGIQKTLKSEIEKKFDVVVNKVNIIFDENYENIEKISLKLKNNTINKIENVEIGNNITEKCDEQYKDIENYISSNYDVSCIEIFE